VRGVSFVFAFQCREILALIGPNGGARARARAFDMLNGPNPFS